MARQSVTPSNVWEGSRMFHKDPSRKPPRTWRPLGCPRLALLSPDQDYKTVSDKTVSDKTVSDKTVSDKTVGGSLEGNKRVSDSLEGDKTVSDKTVSDKSVGDSLECLARLHKVPEVRKSEKAASHMAAAWLSTISFAFT